MQYTPSEIYLEILQESRSPKSSAASLSKLISSSPHLTRTLLSVATSRQRGVGGGVLEPERAALLLGATAIGHVALLHELIQLPDTTVHSSRLCTAFWEDVLFRGAACVLLAHRFGTTHPDIALAAGLSLEMGRLIRLGEQPTLVDCFWESRKLSGDSRIEAEKNGFGNEHVAYFMEGTEGWDLPPEIHQTMLIHHKSPEEIRNSPFPIMGFIARWADVIGEMFTSPNIAESLEACSNTLVKEAGFAPGEVNEFLDQVILQTMMVGDLLGVEIPQQSPLEKRITESKALLSPEAMSHDELLSFIETLIIERDELEDELQLLRRDVHSLTTFDSLTNLPSRGQYMPTLRQEVARARRYERALSLILVDIDEFSFLNSRYGHEAGDAVLEKIASTISKVARDSDFIARTGGDEFAIILTETDSMGGRIFAERIRAAIESLKVGHELHTIRFSASVAGVSLADIDNDNADHETLHASGLMALRKLRDRGPNRVVWVNTGKR
jgi:diguanylate cyclase (GGDEF)-like protein